MTKRCTKCEKEKPIDSFHLNAMAKDGRHHHCKTCRAIYSRENADRAREAKDRWRAANPKRARELQLRSMATWRKRWPEKVNAPRVVYRAIRDGRLFKAIKCSKCGCAGKIEAHHEDYSKPLDIVWLCVPCHKQLHKDKTEFEVL